MWPYHPDLLATPVPRYTSYPTAAEFTEEVGAVDQARALADVAPGADVSLYVHIPYCRDICWYCGCNTGAVNRAQRLTAYLDALDGDIATTAALLGGPGRTGGEPGVRVSRIAFGGGSPNAIAPVAFVRLLDRLVTAFGDGTPSVSVELDPRTLDADWYRTLAGAGVTRASLGVQTFDDRVQAAIGRIQPHALIAEATRRLRDGGIGSLNFDLMYGLPGQTGDSLAATLDAAVALAPDRIALFGYAHVPDRLPRQRRIDAAILPDGAARFAMAATGHQRLVAAGYVPVGFDHYARPGDPLADAALGGRLRRNFQGFTDDDADVLIGLGASAISLFPDLLVQNEHNAGRYRMRAGAGRPTGARGIRRDRAERERALVIEDIVCGRPADLSWVIAADPAIADRLAPFVAADLAGLSGGTLRPRAAGRPYWRGMAAAIDPWRRGQSRRFSAAI